MTEAFTECSKYRRVIWPITLFLTVITLFASEDLGLCKKSKAEIQYELEVEYINNRKDLDWSEKVKARLEAHERIFEPEKLEKRLLKEAAQRREALSKNRSEGSEKGEKASQKTESRNSILFAVYFYAIMALALIFFGYKIYLKYYQKRLTNDEYKLKKKPILFLILKLSPLAFLVFCLVLGIIEQTQNYIAYQDRPINKPDEREVNAEKQIPFSITAKVISPNTIVLKIKTNLPEIFEGSVFISKLNTGSSKAEVKYEKKIQIDKGLKVVIIEGQQNGLDRGNYLAGIRLKANGLSEKTIEKTVPVYLADALQPSSVSGKFVHTGKTEKLESCYDLGYKFGMCTTKAMNGFSCEPENDIIIPQRCRNKAATKSGIESGVKHANAIMLGKKTDNPKPFSGLPQLRKRLVGKTENQVIEVLGRPSRTEMFAGKNCWIYGNTFTSEDIGIVFDGGKVLTVTYY